MIPAGKKNKNKQFSTFLQSFINQDKLGFAEFLPGYHAIVTQSWEVGVCPASTLTCDSKAHGLRLSALYSEIKRKEVLIHDSRDEPGPRKHEANWMKPDTKGHIL